MEQKNKADVGSTMIDKNAQQFEALFNYATIGIIVTDKHGVIINFNRYAEEQFGYTRNEIINQVVEILIPVAFKHSHIHYREAFYKEPHPRVMGAGRDLYALKKDGTQFPVEVSLSYFDVNGETYVMAFVIDITVRK